jgi:hypothetical protein
MRAWWVGSRWTGGVLVAARTPGQARHIGARLMDTEFTGVGVRRVRGLDDVRTEAGEIDWGDAVARGVARRCRVCQAPFLPFSRGAAECPTCDGGDDAREH